MWLDENRLSVPSLNHVDEHRWLIVAEAFGKMWTAIVTQRGEATRIISVRRARDYEVEHMGEVRKTVTAEELDRRFDDGEDVREHFDWENPRRPGLETKRVNVDFPQWMVTRLDQQARRRGVTRQALIKLWLADRLEGVQG